jgi:hypothetical protein
MLHRARLATVRGCGGAGGAFVPAGHVTTARGIIAAGRDAHADNATASAITAFTAAA